VSTDPQHGKEAQACASALGIPRDADAMFLVELLLDDVGALLTLLEHVAEAHAPDESLVPDVDALVEKQLADLYLERVEDPSLVTKKKRIGPQNRLLLAMLLEWEGEWVALVDLLLANNLSTDTPKRIRELREEHGGWDIESSGSGRGSRYRLRSSSPDLVASAAWWLKNNIRNSQLPPQDRILTLLKARLGSPVPLEEIRYVNPQKGTRGRGQTRSAQSETTRRLRALREEGWQVYSGLDKVVAGLAPSDYIMLTVERLPTYERIKPAVWGAVLDRDRRTCQNCHWQPSLGSSQGRKCLEVHHRDPQRARPTDVNNPSNLVTLCNICHDAFS
jgi:hypothetical protein